MRTFDVRLNGKQLCVAGIDGDGALNAMVDYTAGHGGQRLSLTVGGLGADADKFLTWSVISLNVGDEITLKIVEADSADSPQSRTPREAKQDMP
jgi:hypothetical protein